MSVHEMELDTDQWVDVAVSMGAKYIVFVAKHATPFGVKQLAWRDGKGDMVADLAESCSRQG